MQLVLNGAAILPILPYFLHFVTFLFTSIALFTPRWLTMPSAKSKASIDYTLGLYQFCTVNKGIGDCNSVQGGVNGFNSYFSALNASLAFICIAYSLEILCIFVLGLLFLRKVPRFNALLALLVMNGITVLCILIGTSIFAGKANAGISAAKNYLSSQGTPDYKMFFPYFDYSFILSWFAMIFALFCEAALYFIFYMEKKGAEHMESNIRQEEAQQSVFVQTKPAPSAPVAPEPMQIETRPVFHTTVVTPIERPQELEPHNREVKEYQEVHTVHAASTSYRETKSKYESSEAPPARYDTVDSLSEDSE